MSIIKMHGFVLEDLENINNKFLLANGFIGLTGSLDELRQKDFCHLKVNQLTVKEDLKEKYLSVYNPFYTSIKVNDIILHPENITPKRHTQELDLDKGILKRDTVYEIDGVDIRIYSEKFLDQENFNFLYSKYIFFTSKSIEVELTHGFDVELIDFYKKEIADSKFSIDQDIFLHSALPNHHTTLDMIYSFDRNFRHRENKLNDFHQISYVIKTEEERDYEIIKYAGLSTTGDIDSLKEGIKNAKKVGYYGLLEKNNEVWDKLWGTAKVDIVNNSLVERYSHYNQFQLIQHRPKNENFRYSRYGLTDSQIVDDYTYELYGFRFFLNTDYSLARLSLSSRIRYLDKALIGNEGACYSNLYLSSLIIINLYDYIERSMDSSLLREGGLTMVLEISKNILKFLKPNIKKTNYQATNVSTLDGTIEGIDNDAFLNYLIKDALGKANNLVALAKTEDRVDVENFLKVNNYDEQIKDMREYRRKLYLQQPNVDNLIECYDGFFKSTKKLSNPDVLNLFFLYPNDFKEIVKRESYRYYKEFSSPDVLGKFILSFVGISQDEEREANKLFRSYLGLNVYDDANRINQEQNFLDLGLSAAIYNYLVYGMACLRHDKYLLSADSFNPNDIRRLEFKVLVAGNVASVKIKRNSANIEWE